VNLGNYLTEYCSEVRAEHHKVPQDYPHVPGGDPECTHGQSFQGGHALDDFTWRADAFTSPCGGTGFDNDDLRFLFAKNTCNGCHGRELDMKPSLGEAFHIQPRARGAASKVSRFLSGAYSFTDSSGRARTIDERASRVAQYRSLLCGP